MRSRAVLAAAALLAVAACGGGGDDDDDQATPDTTSRSRSTTTTTAASEATGTTGSTGSTTGASTSTGGCWAATPTGGGDAATAFDDATESSGLDAALVGMRVHAVASGDVNGDGWLDLFVGTFADRPEETYRERGADGPSPDQFLLGGPDGFTIDESFPGELARTTGAAFADLDGDGDLDLVAARNVRERSEIGRVPTTIYRNDDGRLVAAETLLDESGSRAVGVLDHDGDGDLDLFVVEDRFTGGSSRLLENEGSLRFEDVTEDAGLPLDIDGLGLGVGDLTGDGRADLVVGGSNRVFVATDDGFEEAPSSELEWPEYGDEDDVAGVALGDADRDGRLDLVLGQHYGSTTDQDRSVPVRLYLNGGPDDDGMPRFRDVTEASDIDGFPTKAPDVQLADLDADGWLDLVVSASSSDGTRPSVLRNLGPDDDGVPHFASADGLGDPQYWVSAVVADFDRDGRLDVFAGEFEPDLPSRLFRGSGVAGHWIAVDGSALALGGMGATVEVRSSSGDLLGAGEISATTGYAAGAPPIVHVGTGDVTTVDVTITPDAGDPIELQDVGTDQLIRPPAC